MRFHVDQTRCRSNGNCVERFPELFRFSPGSKKAVAIDRELPPERMADSVAILRCCPVDAIRVTTEATSGDEEIGDEEIGNEEVE